MPVSGSVLSKTGGDARSKKEKNFKYKKNSFTAFVIKEK